MEITTAAPCNTKCFYCPQGVLEKNYRGEGILKPATFNRFMNKIPQKVRIHFSGFCDPFQNKNCSYFITYALFRGHTVVVYTNLLNIHLEQIDYLVRDVKDKFHKFYIHAPHPLTNKFMQERFLRNVTKLHEGGFPFEVVIVETTAAVYERLKDLGIHHIDQRMIERAGNIMKTGKHFGPIFCTEDRQRQNVIMPNGDVYLCCQDYALRHKLGNLCEMEYDDLYESEEYKKILAGFNDDKIDTLCRWCEKAAVKS